MIKEALIYIDEHLDEVISYESVAKQFYLSPYYFHRMFSAIIGQTITEHIRDRRLLSACIQLSTTDKSILNVGLDCGFQSAQSFSRSFRKMYGISPNNYRKQGLSPIQITVDELIMKFTNRLKGGIILNPNIIKNKNFVIAGVAGDGNQTWDIWNQFEALCREKPLDNKQTENGYEIRIYDKDNNKCIVHVGYAVLDENVPYPYSVIKLPASTYASFDVYVANGYESENNAMNEWLKTNKEGYTERLIDNKNYCVEFYDHRFNGNESGSIVEIWIPVERK